MNDLEFECELDRLTLLAAAAGELGSVAVQGGFLLCLINAYRERRVTAERVQDAHMAGWVKGHNNAVLAMQGVLEDAVAEAAKAMGEMARVEERKACAALCEEYPADASFRSAQRIRARGQA